ncbi:hypothetical protein [Clostridium perfringens]|uniref:Uncharacterized protein n=2 Tax=Clostridium perfringens TaxID=1502 RepID=A0AAP6WL01_CLOPF|nr:hypothetical protein [Clostridium perfringens]EDT22473.1 conserved hypothetical protein [Clostridium perfringens B str. ATCC 3626]ELC8438327.1 hypothetical protein [Clostridium perfringens]MCX0415654.1 hypothetical protein [Clostridium perfringens]MDU3646210.1 hypothetical protein [Clostridium perfringens]NGU29026.1 hypothetical protein [Clostridium perfringens]
MKIFLKKFFKFIILLFLIFIAILSTIYLIIALKNLVPMGIQFLNNKYIATSDIMPNYSTVFESVFTLLGTLTSLIVSLLLYRLTEKQNDLAEKQSIDSYNREVMVPTIALYFKIKFYILNMLIKRMIEEKEGLKNNDSKDLKFIFNELPKIDTKDIDKYLFLVMGEVNDRQIKNLIFGITEDIKASKNVLGYILKEDLMNDENNLVEDNALVWENVVKEIYFDNYNSFTPLYKRMIENLYELSQKKKTNQ